EAYRSTLAFVGRAADALAHAAGGRIGLGGQTLRTLGDTEREELLTQALPVLRGTLLEDADGVVLEVDRSPDAVAFASSARAGEVSQIGAPCPDHLINTKHKPLVVEFDPDRDGPDDLAESFRRGVEEYARWYRD